MGLARLTGRDAFLKLLVDEGDLVKRGEVLARLDTYAIKAAEVKRVQVALDHAKRVLKRQQELKKSSFQSEAALDEATRARSRVAGRAC